MPDSIELNLGAGGELLATDAIGGYHYQLIKLGFGAENAFTYVDDTNPFPISDAGGSITVDNAGTFAVQAAQTGTWTVQPGNTANTTPWLMSIHDGTNKASVRDLGSNDALNVAICDGSGNQITTFGGGTEYTEGDTAATPDGGVVMFKDSGNVINSVSAATPLPVEPGTGVAFPVTDNSGSLTVDNAGTFAVQAAQSGTWNVANTGTFAVQAAQSGTWTVQPGNTANTTPWLMSIHDGTNKASVRNLGSNDALNVSICDGSGNQITSFGGGTEYSEGAGALSFTGSAIMWRDGSDVVQAVRLATALPVQPGTSVVFPVSDNSGSLTVDNAGTFAVQAAQSGTWTIQPGNTANTTPWLMSIHDGTNKASVRDLGSNDALNVAVCDGSGNQITAFPVTDNGGALTVDNGGTFAVQAAQSGTWAAARTVGAADDGITPYSLIAAGSTNATSVKASAGRLHWMMVFNFSTSVRYLKLYNKASAPTVGSDTPVLRLPIPPNSNGFQLSPAVPLVFSSGIAFALTTGILDTDSTGVSANDVVVNLGYV